MRIGTRLLVVVVLVLGIVMMHHVAQSGRHELPVVADQAAGHAAAMSPTGTHADPAGSGPGSSLDDTTLEHGLLHLCLAVVTAAALLVIGRLLRGWRWLPAVGSTLTPAVLPVRRRPAPPRPYGTVLLTSLCVLRT
ncbi:DUF6153 family protein [Jiangella gansuensis]|uniref:DUF6153 family protein n=1 Tax=Jiangella gansuensis TaxID=281473 RepID=UPI0004B660BA|nr:DUF6153 family protein [Jiangella gansuensis]